LTLVRQIFSPPLPSLHLFLISFPFLPLLSIPILTPSPSLAFSPLPSPLTIHRRSATLTNNKVSKVDNKERPRRLDGVLSRGAAGSTGTRCCGNRTSPNDLDLGDVIGCSAVTSRNMTSHRPTTGSGSDAQCGCAAVAEGGRARSKVAGDSVK